MPFKLISSFKPTGDQPTAIEKLASGVHAGARHQTLLGATGSGKTFTMANVITRTQKPTLVISPNKTLAAQLYQEFKEFFPENAVHYFVSYYDYYQPEAYLPTTDTYIEKDAKINELIDALRHASTASILTREDVIIIASVSCIYGIGDPEEYEKVSFELAVGNRIAQKELSASLADLQYVRNPIDPRQGHFRVRGNRTEIFLPSGEDIIAVDITGSKIAGLGKRKNTRVSEYAPIERFHVFPAKHFVTPHDRLALAVTNIKQELRERLDVLKKQEKVLEAARLKQRTEFDVAMLQKIGYVSGIENYSRHLDFRTPNTPPFSLIDYLRYVREGDDFLTFIDESHVTVPQIRGMYFGDRSRKQVLVHYGFRLPSALDNRPLTFEEFDKKTGPIIYVSATPRSYELEKSCPPRHPERSEESSRFFGSRLQNDAGECFIAEQLIRPTAILDPQIEVRPTAHQIQDVINEVKMRIAKKERSLVLALTKRLAEDIADYLKEAGIDAAYLHSEVKTLERPEVLKRLRTGAHDVLVGINLLREGLDLPEVSFIAVLDADKEGFLRNRTTLLQIIGRAARHIDGRVILYGDTMTGSMRDAIRETDRRRKIQWEHNRTHGITPQPIVKGISGSLIAGDAKDEEDTSGTSPELLRALKKEMQKASKELHFELAARIRDRIARLTKK